MRRAGLLSAVVLCLLGVSAAGASATIFKGKTSAGKRALLKTDKEGVPTFASIKWRTDNCNRRGVYLRTSTGFDEPFDRVNRSKLVDEGRYVLKDRAYRIKLRVSIRAEQRTPRLWKGSFGARATILKHGATYDHCALRKVDWFVQAGRR